MCTLISALAAGILLVAYTFTSALQVGTPTAVANPLVAIRAPRPGEVLQGTVLVQGSTDIPGFQSAELLFAYAHDPSDTWFLIQTLEEPVAHGLLAEWDTSLITDGDYQLRLIVILDNGGRVMAQVGSLRVRNYTPIETNTPLPKASLQAPLVITASPTSPRATPTPLPTNPAILTTEDIRTSVLRGGGMAFGIALLGLAYAALRRVLRLRS